MSIKVVCPKCERELEIVGAIGSGTVGPDCKLPECRTKTAWCPNKECSNYQVLGEIVSGKFIFTEE